MKASLIKVIKTTDENGNTVEVRIWQLPKPTADKPHGYKYSLAYIVNEKRVIGYDNAERKGDHRHYGETEAYYKFKSIDKLFEYFHKDIERYKEDQL